MLDQRDVETLAFKFYDTLINSDGWENALDGFASVCGASASSLFIADSLYPKINERVFSRQLFRDEEDLESYMAQNGTEEAQAYEVVYSRPVKTWVSDAEAFGKPADHLASARFHLERSGLFRRSACRLNQTPLWNDGLVVLFDKDRGNLTDQEAKISFQLLPHIAKVIELGRPFRLLQQRFNGVLGVLNKLKIGVVISTPQGAILATNQRARECSDMADGLSISREQRIKLSRPEDQAILDRQIAEASAASDPSRYKGVLTAQRRGSQSPWILETFCLSELTGEIDGQFNGACTFIIDPDHKESVSTDGMREAFGLTKAESDVCKLLAEGLKVNEIAESRNTTPETIRSQIKAAFTKTDSNSQSDLIRQALRLNLPVDEADDDS